MLAATGCGEKLPLPREPALGQAQPPGIRSVLSHPGERVLGEPLREPAALARFYAGRGDQPAWLTGDRAAGARARTLLEAVQQADRHGLRPAAYHARALARELEPGAVDAQRLAELELLLSDAFLHLARHLANGAVDPRSLHPGYQRAGAPAPDAVSTLAAALASGKVRAALEGLAPPHPEYAGLQQALRRLQAADAAGGWPHVPDGPPLELGARDARVVALRARLASSAAPVEQAADPALFDASLADALRDFQRHHGLASDGVLGSRTVAALNATAGERADQVRVNLERWRWLPRDFGQRHLRVNIPGFTLRAYDGARPALAMRVVVGEPGWTTPLAHGVVQHLVLNPAWAVPRSIATREMLPAARRDPGYFRAKGIQVLVEEKGSTRELDPRRIDWKAVQPGKFPFHLRQRPGPFNPLGRIKFIFPNPYGVYLHGTPGDAAFDRPARNLSHGCVRVEDELALAGFMLAPDPEWTRERLLEALRNAWEHRVPLQAPLPVHLLYSTAAADADGAASFTGDPYGWDGALLDRLRSDPALASR